MNAFILKLYYLNYYNYDRNKVGAPCPKNTKKNPN